MSKAAELIAGLHVDASFDSDGSFSLDREKARQKMRQFQLADPHRYVLLLVEAAALRGAKTIVFEIDSDDMRMQFDAQLSYADLDELYTSLFVDRTSVEIRSRRELALACNAVMALNPKWVRIESCAADGGAVAATLEPEAQDEIRELEAPESPPEGMRPPWTTIHVKDRFRPGLLVRFLHDIRGSIPEEVLIKLRCVHASIAISLDGVTVARGLPDDLIGGVAFATDELRGVAGLETHEDRRTRSAIVLMSNGVEIATHDLEQSIAGLWFWIDGSQFRKDVSQADIVRGDPAYQTMIAAVARARDRVLERLVESWHAGEFTKQSTPTANEVFDLLRDAFVRWADHNWLRPDAGPLGKLAGMPIWRTVDRRWISPRELEQQAETPRGIMFTDEDFDGVTPEGWGPVVHLLDPIPEAEAMTRVYSEAKSVTAVLRREVPWELNRRAWRARIHAVELPYGTLRHPMAFESGEYRGRVALRPGQLSNVRVIVDGCLLNELELDLGFVGLCAVISGPLDPSTDYTRARNDRAYATLLLLLLGQMPRLLQAWADDPLGGEVVQRSLVALTRPDFAVRWLVAFGFVEAAAKQLVERVGAPSVLPEFGLGGPQPETAVARIVCFTTVDLRRVSLAELGEERHHRPRHNAKILVVDRSAPSSTGVAELIVHANHDDRRLLAVVFGPEAIHDDTADYVREIGRRNFLAKPERSPAPPVTTWTTEVRLALDGGGEITGYVGVDAAQVRDWDGGSKRRATIEVMTERRALCRIEEHCWLPGVEAVFEWTGAKVTPEWDGLAGPTKPLRTALDHGLVQILLECAAKFGEQLRPGEDVRRLLWMAIVAPFVSTKHFRAWSEIRRHHGDDHAAAVETYAELMELFPGVPLANLLEALELLHEDGTLPTADAVLSLVDRKPKRSGGREFHRQILTHLPRFETVRLLELVNGTPCSLAQIVAHHASSGEVAYVEERSLRFDDDGFLIVRKDAVDHVALLRLFARESFNEVSAWIHERLHQQKFEQREQLEHVRLRQSTRLVGVEFERDEFVGELAIPDWTPGDAGEMKITFCHERRVIQEIELHAKLPVIGIVDDPKPVLNTDYTEVDTRSSRIAALRRVLDDVLDDVLLPRLAESYPQLDPRQASLARSWIGLHWRRVSPYAGRHPNRLSEAGKLFAKLKLFRDVDGTARSLDELIARFAEHRCLYYVEHDPGHAVAPPFPIVEARSDQLELLDGLFPTLEDFSPRWKARLTGERRKQAAEAMPQPAAPPDALVSVELSRHDIQGVLWLPSRYPFNAGVVLGSEGKVVELIEPLELLPALGLVTGNLEVDDWFQSVQLSGPQRRYLEARVVFLYASLLNAHRRDIKRSDKPDFMEPAVVGQRALRFEMLRTVTVALAGARVRGQSFDAIVGNLERRLLEEPLLKLATGKLISVQVARKARPQELAYLKIWDPNGLPEPPPPIPGLEGESEGESERESDDDDEAAKTEAAEAEEAEAELLASLAELAELARGSKDESKPEDGLISLEALTFGLDEIPQLAADLGGLSDAEIALPEPEPDRVGELLELVREELRLLRERHRITLAEGLLDCIDAESGRGNELVRIDERVIFDSAHPRFVRALEDPDPIWISFLASVAYTALNRWLDEVTDDDELAFHAVHAELLLSGLLDATVE